MTRPLRSQSAAGVSGRSRWTPALALLLLLGLLAVGPAPLTMAQEDGLVFPGPVPRADCGPRSIPEPLDVVQGSPPDAAQFPDGFRCNLEVTGHTGNRASWSAEWYDDCAYYNQDFPASAATPEQAGEVGELGTAVVDVSDPAEPVITDYLDTPAMNDPHESLKLNEPRALLAAVAGQDALGNGPIFFDVYDVSADCTKPELTASVPLQIPIGHEGAWAPDGKTYYGSSLWTNLISVIDVSDPAAPQLVTLLDTSPNLVHGLSISADGTRAYLAGFGNPAAPEAAGNGLEVWDVSGIQARTGAAPAKIGSVYWTDGSAAQHTIPVTIKGKPYVIFADEGGAGSARIIDISDETKPVVVSKLKLELHLGDSGASGTHYCSVDRMAEPTVLGCSFWGDSGVRVFDIRDPEAPKEIAYLNLPGSFPTTDLRFIRERGEIWFSDQREGFYTARFTNGVWPFDDDPCGGLFTPDYVDRASVPAVHRPAVDCLVAKRITVGAGAAGERMRYAPAKSVTRGQMASFLVNTLTDADRVLPPAREDAFDDIAESPHRDNITRLAAAGIINGVDDTRFAPSAAISRAQMASFMVAAAEYATGTQLRAADGQFRDVGRAHPHRRSIDAGQDAGLFSGTTAKTFSPDAAVRRDQMATFLVNLRRHLAR